MKTPWQKVVERFGISQNALAIECGWHRSKISRAVRREPGTIDGDDQVKLIDAAKRMGIPLTSADLTPETPA